MSGVRCLAGIGKYGPLGGGSGSGASPGMQAAFASLALLTVLIHKGCSILCYQCDSNEDDTCPASRRFEPRLNALVDCGSFQARVPGTFCIKIYQESTGWFSWIKITRRCAARTDYGVAKGCRYWFDDQGVYHEVCYCQDRDGCNAASQIKTAFMIATVSVLILFLT
ncbi:expressed conserved protein [Echinococcus multilocularis]|uniref:UPAR/Ly6 domain-containing protein qvr n=1 Tax=Echinococcus multilocularis TaxID=6211 RepID=A0A068YMQ3_ECHMU|nr:expressed conserved protein [Echinococcus multilocularis]